MRTFYAILACLAIFMAYVMIGVALGWKRGGGAIPNIILFFCLAGVWKAIRSGGGEQVPQVPPLEEWERQPSEDDNKKDLK